MPTPNKQRVAKRREALRAMGLRPLQIWVPDARLPGFSDECRRQALVVAEADASEEGLADFLDAAFADLNEADE